MSTSKDSALPPGWLRAKPGNASSVTHCSTWSFWEWNCPNFYCNHLPEITQNAQRDLTHPGRVTRCAADILLCFSNAFYFSQKSQNQLILGVMAIDVSLEDIKRLTPRFTVRAQKNNTKQWTSLRLSFVFLFQVNISYIYFFKHSSVRTKWLLLCYWSKWIRVASS